MSELGQWIRGTNLEVFVKELINDKGLSALEIIKKAKEQQRVIVSNLKLDEILIEKKEWKKIGGLYNFWTGTAIAYSAPNTPFGDKIIFNWQDKKENAMYSVNFAVPEKFRGRINCAIITDHPDFEITELNDKKYELNVADENKIYLVENFPRISGWYRYDEKFRIPSGIGLNIQNFQQMDDTIRRLIRADGCCITILKRSKIFRNVFGIDAGLETRLTVCANYPLSSKFGGGTFAECQ